MSANHGKNNDYQSLGSSAKKNETKIGDISSLKPSSKNKLERVETKDTHASLTNPQQKIEKPEFSDQLHPKPLETIQTAEIVADSKKLEALKPKIPLSFAEEQKQRKIQKAEDKDSKLLNNDRWIVRNGHTLTYVGLFLFTLVVYFRPYEWIPGMEGFTSLAMIFAVITLLLYLPTQIATEGSFTILTTEVKCILFITAWAILTMPIAKDPAMAWGTFYDLYSKVVLIFIVMVNTLRTKSRLTGLMWLSIAIGVFVSSRALQAFNEGKFEVEGYRVNASFGGMFDNPNDMCVHLVMFIPVAVALGLGTKNILGKLIYFVSAGVMLFGVFVTQSRGGFIGLVAVFAVIVWKLSKKSRVKIILASVILAIVVILIAPGNYGERVMSIFDSTLDPTGSSNQRTEILWRSIFVTLRNPTGIGMNNFPIVSIHNLQTHNAFTQVSAELGWLSLAAYLIFMISPFRKLGVIERRMFTKDDSSWMYYLAIGLQAGIIGYMFSSFFASVAYQWYIYYPVAYAICLRRIYQLGQQEDTVEVGDNLSNYFKLKEA